MAASGADIRDILSLSGPSSTPAHPPPKKPAKAQKPEGISRELYSLIGDHAPTLAAVQRAKPKFKQKPDLGRGKVRWEWRSFANGARKDSLKLGHWEKVKDEQPTDYPFAKYNTGSNIYTYTPEEYSTLLKDEDWTQEETDYLFSLIKEYDMRFYVIADRYDFPGGKPRSLEDLKDRYYSVCRKLIRSRPWTGDESAKTALLNSYQFDKERERTRKMYVASLFARTPEQIAEEEALYIEIKRLEQTERRFAKEREELMKTVAGIESGLNVHQPDEEAFSGLFIDPRKRKKRGDGLDGDSPSSAGPSSVPPRRMLTAKQMAQDSLNCITREETSAVSTKTAHLPVHLRSSRMPYPKASIAAKVTPLLAELGVSLNRLVMPTKDNIQHMEKLLEAATTLVDMKKAVDRIDQEIKTQKKLLGLIAEEDRQESTGVGEGEEESGGDKTGDILVNEDGTTETMDVDQEESAVILESVNEGTTSRRQSQSHKRSLSISSVETSATAATRASRSTKRARKA